MCVRSWIRSQTMYALRDSSGETSRQAASGGRLRRRISAALPATRQALRLAVAEDRAEVARRAFGGREGLGEEDGALGVVPAGVVDEGDGDVLGVVVARALELGDELGPGGADDQRLEAGVPGGVLLVHREHGEVLDAVATVLLGAEGLGGAHEVGLGEPRVRPGAGSSPSARCSRPGGGSGARGAARRRDRCG